ncbi:phosphoribosylformylglycinamidine synthase [Luteolibacter sp. GHJ8]|uniref:Phosphoribosylformylglycinamidine synthase n=1 Tax=Luteolibacter rhizosphaerae TaxID=2989719 RepID=A0ABT3G8J7_9BACT|nr:phosphoribosylformylglycinamidine synthase [Luteolibacter rhizosphaerae]MCW1916176.1 phosphoribosylformylglycinamidine synthase [Luteolibacter rhizosphaerae]
MNRIFVEKKPEFNAEARHLLHDLKESLGLEGLKGVRVIQRYDVDGLSGEEFSQAVGLILSEPQVDITSADLALAGDENAFAVEYLPGQFDQRADSAAQCVQILTGKERPLVSSAKVMVLKGGLSADEVAKVKGYVINAVDSHEARMDLPETLQPKIGVPADVAVLAGFTGKPAADLAALRKELGLAMSDADLVFCQNYFRDEEKRDPSITEIRMLDTYWSDHCRHTTFLTKIDEVNFEPGAEPVKAAWESYLATRQKLGREDKPVTLMDIALIGMRELKASGELDNLEVSEEVNAASIVVPVSISGRPEEEWLVMFKNETHNHPTEIEPFGGAATCLGGCIRDPLSGRSYVYQAMRVTGAGNPLTPFAETLPGKLPQKKICQIAAHGYSSYGNQIGLATGQVSEVYHPGYVAKRMEIGAVVAAAPRSQVFRGTPAAGDVILLTGGRTGRDGVGGATGSSKEHTDTALENSAEVQKGDAPTERKIQRLFRNPELTKKIKICNDFGAGGVSVAIGEIAPSLEIDLDAVPKKYEGLDGTELAISESQERMAVCIDPADAAYFIAECDKENLECVKVADVTDTGRLRMKWRGKVIVDLSRAFLDTNGVQQLAKVSVGAPQDLFQSAIVNPQSATALLSELNYCSQKGLGERFDSSVGAGTVLWPFGGKHQLTPPDAMVAKLPLLEGDTDVCTYMSWGFNPQISSWSPFHGAVYAVTESVCKVVAAGGRLSDIRLTLQEYFPKLGGDAARWGLPFAALLGAYHAQHGLRLAAIGGKDSMSGSFNDLDVPPTLVSFALAPGLASRALSPEFKQAGNTLSLVEVSRDDNNLPDYERLKEVAEQLHQLNAEGKLVSVKALGAGGLMHGVATSAFGNGIGAKISSDLNAYAERYFGFLIEHTAELPEALGAEKIGETIAASRLEFPAESHNLAELQAAWLGTLEPIYPTKEDTKVAETPHLTLAASFANTMHRGAATKHSKPKVLIPAFPGTNSEYDSAKAFNEAGGESEIQVFRNLTARHIEESLEAFAAQIRKSQILMFPGGFSAGDEPDGSAKFIATVIRNPRVADAIMDLIKNRDGLVLGVCNGFQALIKTGLVPYGEIRDPQAEAPTLTFNDIGRHVSCYVTTRIASTLSPWLAGMETGELHSVPVSHGEGKFLASPGVIAELAAKGQIATQYVDTEGVYSMEIDTNPNGSLFAIEGITSPCGRVFGKMAHTERSGSLVGKNIPGEKRQPIFAAGVKWFA